MWVEWDFINLKCEQSEISYLISNVSKVRFHINLKCEPSELHLNWHCWCPRLWPRYSKDKTGYDIYVTGRTHSPDHGSRCDSRDSTVTPRLVSAANPTPSTSPVASSTIPTPTTSWFSSSFMTGLEHSSLSEQTSQSMVPTPPLTHRPFTTPFGSTTTTTSSSH